MNSWQPKSPLYSPRTFHRRGVHQQREVGSLEGGMALKGSRRANNHLWGFPMFGVVALRLGIVSPRTKVGKLAQGITLENSQYTEIPIQIMATKGSPM